MQRREMGEWGFKPLKKWYQSNKRGELERDNGEKREKVPKYNSLQLDIL